VVAEGVVVPAVVVVEVDEGAAAGWLEPQAAVKATRARTDATPRGPIRPDRARPGPRG